MLDAGYWFLDPGYWFLDTGFSSILQKKDRPKCRVCSHCTGRSKKEEKIR